MTTTKTPDIADVMSFQFFREALREHGITLNRLQMQGAFTCWTIRGAHENAPSMCVTIHDQHGFSIFYGVKTNRIDDDVKLLTEGSKA